MAINRSARFDHRPHTGRFTSSNRDMLLDSTRSGSKSVTVLPVDRNHILGLSVKVVSLTKVFHEGYLLFLRENVLETTIHPGEGTFDSNHTLSVSPIFKQALFFVRIVKRVDNTRAC